MAKRVLYLIRNGEHDRKAMDDEFNAPLTERGLDQARRTARALRDLPIQTIYTSPYEQTGSTADMIRQARPTTDFYISEELKQYQNTGANQTFTRKMLQEAFDDDSQPPIEDAFKRFFQPAPEHDIHEVLVCHGNIILDLICHATGVNPDVWSHMLINHCSINIIAIESSDDIQLVAFNDVRHLPDSLRTE